jgi:hypothetical protein
MKIGICALCKKRPIELCDSHLMPKAIYRRIHDGMPPIMVDPSRKTALHTNFQIRSHLLCSNCEARIAQRGEQVVLKNYYIKNEQFPLRDALHKIPMQPEGLWFGRDLPSTMNVHAFTYFAVSVFWRASVGKWNCPHLELYRGSINEVALESFREYLLSNAPLPPDVLLGIKVHTDNDCDANPMSTPRCSIISSNGISLARHDFMIPGLHFELLVGHGVRRLDEYANGSPTFVARKFIGSSAHRQIFNSLIRITPKSELRKTWPEITSDKTL